MKKRTTPLPNYIKKLHHLARLGVLPRSQAHAVDVLHDDWCAFLADQRKACDCNPDIRLKVSIPGNLN